LKLWKITDLENGFVLRHMKGGEEAKEE